MYVFADRPPGTLWVPAFVCVFSMLSDEAMPHTFRIANESLPR